MIIEAMKLALEHIEGNYTVSDIEAITALRQAIEQAQKQEPYKGIAEHLNQATNGRIRIDHVTGDFGIGSIEQAQKQEPVSVTYNEVMKAMNSLYAGDTKQVQIAAEMGSKKLYTSSPQRQWVGLTDEEFTRVQQETPYNQFMTVSEYATQCQIRHEAKLKEKNT